jgi:predicted alpha-1,2-mannosidase
MKKLFLIIFAVVVGSSAYAQTKDYTRHVNPFIGTGGHGHTFPGATMPFGMVQLSPDTRIDNWDGSSGYHYSDDIVYGFSHTHLSGTGIPDYCDILFMPAIAEYESPRPPNFDKYPGYASKFSHSDEVATPGYYSVRLADRKVTAELTATQRVGFHRYTFPQSRKAGINLDLDWRDRLLDGDYNIVDKKRVEGFRRSSSWAKKQTVYFVAEFSRPFDEIAISETGGKKRSAFFAFSPKAGDQILLKVAISPVSIEGARTNLAAELPGWDFDKVLADAKAAWNKELSKIEVSGGTDEQTTNFYTALYHTMIQPNVFNDVDGRYKGHDGKIQGEPVTLKKKENPQDILLGRVPQPGDHYTVFSLWDTFRAAHPLYTIIDQKRTVDFINTFIRIYEQGGRLPVWELWGEETDTMIGYHAVSVIADAMAKGIKGFDYEKAYAAAKHSAELDHHGLAAYKKRGYISMEDENESVSKTLEYAYNDWCIAQMASVLHKTDDTFYYQKEADKYLRRSRYFENLFDPRVGFFVPKKNGGFVRPFAANEVTFSFTEGNSWQYSFFVPHDVMRLMELMGGNEKFTAKLDELFTTNQKLIGREQPDITGLIGQYAHGNEPSHHIPYLFNYAGQPWKTQKYVRKIMDEFYKNSPDGLIGNEDCGQMSAWYVLSASGFYPVTPGSPIYAFGTPLFPEMTYRLENGRKFTIRAKNVSDKNIFIRSATLNGKHYSKAYITHAEIMGGGILEFSMADQPMRTAFSEFPFSTMSFVGGQGLTFSTIAVPQIEGARVFRDTSIVFIRTATPNAKIHYTLDGSEPTEKSHPYAVPVRINQNTTVKAIAVAPSGDRSLIAEAIYSRRPNDWTVTPSPYSTQYTGGGDHAIIDGIRGTVNFASGEWQGYQGKVFEAVIDLQRETAIKEIGGGFLQSARSWIWMPERVEFEASKDGANFVKIADFKPGFPQTEMNTVTKDFLQRVTPTKARYVRVKANNFGKIPAWHPGAGGDPWIFVDEIFIR